MAHRTLNVAAIQTAAHDRTSFREVWPGIAERARGAAREGARLIVLPEGTLPAYVLGYRSFEESEIAAGLEDCRAIARRFEAVIVAGAARRDGARLFNSAIVIDRDGSIAGAADKHFLWHFDRQWFAAGERLEPIQTSIGCLGALICADGRIPTIARALVDRGAEILVMPTAWVTSGRDPDNLENIQADLLATVRARENDVPFVAANKCGVEMGCVAYCGKSQILRADGTVSLKASQDREDTIIATVELRAPKPSRAESIRAALGRAALSHVQRIAITAREPQPGDDDRKRILEADVLLYGNVEEHVNDACVMDPGGLAEIRRSEKDFVVWRTSLDPLWQIAFARARALELRMYVVAVDTARGRAFAVDPDGAVLCGTFDGYDIASFTYDPARTAQTLVAPGTDVRLGLERAAQHAPR